MTRHPRLKAAICTGVLAATLATPTLDSALASNSVPALPNVSAALLAAGITSGNATSILSELNTLQGVAPLGSLPLLSLSAVDNALTTLNGGLLGALLTPVLTLLTALNPAAPTNVTETLTDLQQIGSAPGATAAVQEAVSELSAALNTAGLGQLLTDISSLTALQDTSALSALAGLQSLGLGGSAAAGSLAPVATVLTDLAAQGGVPSGDVTELTGAAATLNGSGAISPAALVGVIGELQSASASLPSPLNGVASAVANQLAASTSIFGQLASVGSAPSASSITGALTGLGALPGLSEGAAIPSGSLAPVASVLTTLATEPGVLAPAAATLNSVASSLSGAGAISPTALLSLIASLQGVSGLPAPLGSLVTEVTSSLAGSGSIFGGVPGLSSTQVIDALDALQALPGLSSGSSVASGALAPVGAILTQVASQPGVPTAAATTLDSVAATLDGSGAIDPTSLQGLITTLDGVSGLLPSPLNSVVSQLASSLGGAGSLLGLGSGGGGTGGGTGGTGGGTGGTGSGGTGGGGTGSGGTGGTGTSKGAGSTGGSGSSGGTAGSGGTPGASSVAHSGHAVISRVQRKGDVITVTLRCTASASRTCSTTVSATQSGRQLSRKSVRFRGGSKKRVVFRMRVTAITAMLRHRKAVALKITARTGSYRTSKTLR